MKEKTIKIGYMDLSGKVIVADPWRNRDKWRMAMNVAVKPGRYAVYFIKKAIKPSELRVIAIMAIHTSFLTSPRAFWMKCNGLVGVDSGRYGIFDDMVYPAKDDCSDEHSFYRDCFNLTLRNAQGGILKGRNGAVALSGYGNGLYELFCQYNKGERVAMKLEFILTDKEVATLRRMGKFHV